MNGGMVSFELEECAAQEDGQDVFYRIRPHSIKEIHLGFEGKTKNYVKVQPVID